MFSLKSQDNSTHEGDILSFSVVLVILTIVYIALATFLAILFGHVKKTQYVEDINRYSNSKRIGDRIFIWHFVFLQLCIFFRLVESIILMLNALGYGESVKIWFIRGTRNGSFIFLCVSYSIILYQWIFIAHRVDLYAGVFSVDVFKNRVKLSKFIFIMVI